MMARSWSFNLMTFSWQKEGKKLFEDEGRTVHVIKATEFSTVWLFLTGFILSNQ